jgi:hypothetical protein
MGQTMTDPDETDERKEPRHAEEEYDRHEDDLEPIDPEEVVSDAMDFFTAGDDEPEEPMESPSSP